ncbi:MAG TPA: MarR family transcriptional regulator [Acidimicrobiaceae bacterium]|nr:MarR family transcriptional regulator [Acidimicrobiaceae bacterium]HCV34734.1 MarR family transcriptional regulator [Acidimicrobiaceae bacterium]
MTDDKRDDRFLELATDQVSRALDTDLGLFHLSFVMTRAANRFNRYVESTAHRPRGLTTAGFRVLFTLWSCGPLEAHRIALLAGLSRASVSSVVNTLERNGHVERSRQQDDRRLVTVSLTLSGEKLVLEAYASQHEIEKSQYTVLSADEQRTLTDLLDRLLEAPLE